MIWMGWFALRDRPAQLTDRAGTEAEHQLVSTTFELEGFEPISRLGGGGFGDVWLARQTNVDRQVAIKVGHSAIQDETIRLRFDRECKALGRLSGHPNIVDVYTAGSLRDGRPYLVLEYISDGTLWQRLKKSPIPEAELRAIGSQMASALAEAHSSGVLHRDLKPENILMRSTGEAVLGDFGIARLHDGANTTSAAITASVAYAAPEILSGKRATVASDLYGLGVCLLASISRSVPFVHKGDESIHPIINRVLSDRPPDVRRSGISNEFASIIDSLLAKDPADRPASATELQEQFRNLAVTSPIASGPGNTGATQIVGPAAMAAPPAAPIAPARSAPPVGAGAPQPPAQPGAPRQHAPPPSQDWPSVQPAPAAAGNPYDPRSASAPERTPGRSGDLRLFVLAYVATLIIGGVALFAVSRILADDPDDETGAAAAANSTQQTIPDNQTVPTAEGSGSGSAALTVPLALADTSFGEGAETSDDSPGPGSETLCDNVPATDGLIEWTGQVITTELGLRTLYQVVSRFETAAQAADYLDAYAGTNDCEGWLVETEGSGTTDVFYAALQTAPPTYGDRARQFEITGELDEVPSIHTRVLLVQSGTDVLGLSLTAVNEDQIEELDDLAPLAVERLGYDGS